MKFHKIRRCASVCFWQWFFFAWAIVCFAEEKKLEQAKSPSWAIPYILVVLCVALGIYLLVGSPRREDKANLDDE
ncbi:MAG: hypothetical protein Q4D38_06025 [Planctomycetia bacterium]|nr:hypothetical protein [Planctomycetia bacterium]